MEQPAETPLTHNAATPVDFGLVASGASAGKVFTVRNDGSASLTGLALSFATDGNPADFSVGAPGATSLMPGSDTTFTVTFNPGAAGPRNATLNIGSNDPDKNPFVIHLAGSQATASQAWRMAHFGSPDNSGAAADLSDPDGDGIVNLIEFATATDPKVISPAAGQASKNGDQLEFVYSRPVASLSELSFVLQWSETLPGTWSNVGGSAATVLNESNGIQTVRHSIPAGASGNTICPPEGDAALTLQFT